MVAPALDPDRLNAASATLLGLRDFAAFCKRREGASTTRTLLEFSWARVDDGVLAATVRADAFCHSMVRSLVGSVVPVGEGRQPLDWPLALAAGNRRSADIHVMPALGLQPRGGRLPAGREPGRPGLESRARREPPPR